MTFPHLTWRQDFALCMVMGFSIDEIMSLDPGRGVLKGRDGAKSPMSGIDKDSTFAA